MGDSLNLVFQYFFTAGAGVGAGLIITIGLPMMIYQKMKEGRGKTWKYGKKGAIQR